MNTLNARLDAITCHLEALAASVGTLRLNLANLNRNLVRAGALEGIRREAGTREAATREATTREAASREAATRETSCRGSARRETSCRGSASRETTCRETTCRETTCRGSASREDLDRELSRLRQQLAAFRFESHQEHQELYRAGRDSVVQALIEGRSPIERTWSAEAPGAGYGSEPGSELLTRERSFTVPLCEGA